MPSRPMVGGGYAQSIESLASELDTRFISAISLNDMQQVHGDRTEDDTYGIHRVKLPTSPWDEERLSSLPLSSLDAITIQQLRPSKKYRGRVLYGKFCIEPFMSQSINAVVTLLVDTNANSIRVIMSNILLAASNMESEPRFSMERKVAITEPLVEMCTDGMPAVRVTTLAAVVLVENGTAEDRTAAEFKSDSASLRNIRSEGNRFFEQQNWAGAVKMYSDGINEALRYQNNNNSTPDTKYQEELMLAYSNRAEARLRLEHYEDALSDADEALKIEPKHLKTLVRKGKAAHALQLFEKACEAFKAALIESPRDHFITESLKGSTTALKQSTTGEYDISPGLLRDKTDVPSYADYIGPVEIRVGCGRKGRGLFATRSVKAGEILFVSNALVNVRHESLVHPTMWSRESVHFKIYMNLILLLGKRVMTSKRQMAQLYSLRSDRDGDVAIPSMELFRPGSEYVPEDSAELEMDAELIYDIGCSNSVRNDVQIQMKNGIIANISSAGIWILPSFVNHSCAPNVTDYSVGPDARFFRASSDILEGEELTVSCFDSSLLWRNVEDRRQGMDGTCECARCRLEVRLHPKLSKISKQCSDLQRHLKLAALAGLPRQQGKERDLTKVVDAVELVLQSEGSELGSQEQGWIRASFFPAYYAKFRLANDKGDFESVVSALRLLLDSATSVCVEDLALMLARDLFREVGRRHSKRSQLYRRTLDRVLSVFKVYYGNLPKNTLLKMMDAV